MAEGENSGRVSLGIASPFQSLSAKGTDIKYSLLSRARNSYGQGSRRDSCCLGKGQTVDKHRETRRGPDEQVNGADAVEEQSLRGPTTPGKLWSSPE